MPTTTKRFYIVKTDDQAVVKSVPVAVCAAPSRVEMNPAVESPTCPVEAPAAAPKAEAGGIAGAVKHAVRRPALLQRPHLPHIGRPGR